jgi:hypothetical protein
MQLDQSTTEGSNHVKSARWLPLIPAILLTLVALNQLRLSHTHELDPWKGGGFGMFSTCSGANARHTHVFVSDEAGESEVDLPDDLEDTEDRLLVLPTQHWRERFARELSNAMLEEHPEHTAVRVEIWQTTYDVEDLSPETIRTHEFSAEASQHGDR